MATSSFDKKFVLDTKEAANFFVKAVIEPAESIKIDRSVLDAKKTKRGEEAFLKMLSRK